MSCEQKKRGGWENDYLYYVVDLSRRLTGKLSKKEKNEAAAAKYLKRHGSGDNESKLWRHDDNGVLTLVRSVGVDTHKN